MPAFWVAAGTFGLATIGSFLQYDVAKEQVGVMKKMYKLSREAFETQKKLMAEQMGMLREDRAWWEEHMADQIEARDKFYADLAEYQKTGKIPTMFTPYLAEINRTFETQIANINESMPEGREKRKMIEKVRRMQADTTAKFTSELQNQIANWFSVPLPTGKPMHAGVVAPQYGGIQVPNIQTPDMSGLYELGYEFGKKAGWFGTEPSTPTGSVPVDGGAGVGSGTPPVA